MSRRWFERQWANGLVMVYKRLDDGRFAWPAVKDSVMRLSRAQFEAQFERLDWRLVTPRGGARSAGEPKRLHKNGTISW